MKRTMSFILSLIMVIGIIASVPITVSAINLDDFKFELNADGASYTVVGNNKYMRGELSIPDTYKGLPVTHIGDYGFYGYTDITSIIISDNITSIGECAFSDCCFAESIVIGDNVKTIGNEAFYFCSDATSVVIGDSVQSIGDKAFMGCQGIQGVLSLPATLKKLGYSPFYCCYEVNSIEIPAENKYFSSVDGVLYDKKHTKILQYPIAKADTTYTVLDGVTTITENAFLCAQYVEEVVLPDSVTKIEGWAFSTCENLTYITIPKSLKDIGDAAFEHCEKLKSISLPNDCSLSEFCFTGCSSLESANIPESEYFIPEGVFANCVNLKKINIPKDTWRIWIDAFRNCKSLTSITIPVGIEMIGVGAFSGCENLKNVNFSGTREQWEEMEIFADNQPLLDAYYSNSAPATPKLSSVSCTTTGVKVSWGKAAGIDKYIVYRKTSKTGWSRLGTTTSTSFTDTKAKSGTTYYYTVKAQNDYGTSGYNKTGLKIKYIAAPVLKKVYNNGAGNVLSWGKVTGADGYYVYRKTPSSGWKKIATIKKGSTVSYTDKKVTYGSSYIYTVKAYSGKTASGHNTTGIKIIKKLPNVSITTKNVNGGKRVYLSSSVSGATIYFKTSKNGSYKKYTGDFGLTSTKTIYAYAVRASYYKSSTASKKIVVTKAKSPTISVANCVGGKKITLKTSTPNATLYYKTSKDGSYVKYTEPFVVSSTKTVYAKTYAKGYAASSVVNKKISVSKVSTPTLSSISVNNDSGNVSLKWKAVSGAQGYYIYRADELKTNYVLVAKVSGGSVTSFTDYTYVAGLKNTYKIRAYCSGKATSAYSNAKNVYTEAKDNEGTGIGPGIDGSDELIKSPLVAPEIVKDYEIPSDFKIGFICLHDENSTYDRNFMDAITKIVNTLGLERNQYIIKTNIPESNECYETAKDLAAQGCDIVFANSLGHEDFMIKAAKEYPNVEFCQVPGTKAHTEGVENFHNAYASVHEGRYLTGIVAGMKLNELIEIGAITADEAKMGYVGAFAYSEVISGYTAFYLGAKSVCPSVTMDVQFTGSWFDIYSERKAAEMLMANGCVLISQHSDSMGAPLACEAAGIPNVAYNYDTYKNCPETFMVSTGINWAPYFNYIIKAACTGSDIAADWCGGINEGSIVLSGLNPDAVADGTVEAIEEAIAGFKAGTLKVFDINSFTVNGETLDESYLADVDTDANFTPDTPVVSNGYYHESEYRSAPYFEVRIDGITLLNEIY